MDVLNNSKSSKFFPRNIPNANYFKDYIGSIGISNKHHLIIYDRSPYGFYSATRLWWLFRVLI
jgi:thiosulfate/3-mercaptopyruvate sulfurtransferase